MSNAVEPGIWNLWSQPWKLYAPFSSSGLASAKAMLVSTGKIGDLPGC
jgi:hypothetical protein